MSGLYAAIYADLAMSIKNVSTSKSAPHQKALAESQAAPLANLSAEQSLFEQFSKLLDKVVCNISGQDWFSELANQTKALPIKSKPESSKTGDRKQDQVESEDKPAKEDSSDLVNAAKKDPSPGKQSKQSDLDAEASSPKKIEKAKDESKESESVEAKPDSDKKAADSDSVNTEAQTAPVVNQEMAVAQVVKAPEVQKATLPAEVQDQAANAKTVDANSQPLAGEQPQSQPEELPVQSGAEAPAAEQIASKAGSNSTASSAKAADAKAIQAQAPAEPDAAQAPSQSAAPTQPEASAEQIPHGQLIDQLVEKIQAEVSKNVPLGAQVQSANIAAKNPALIELGEHQILQDLKLSIGNSVQVMNQNLLEVPKSHAIDGIKPSNQGQLNLNLSSSHQSKRSESDSSSSETQKARNLSKPDAQRTLERVQSVLKEVAKSKDGKTISMRLDPPSLGSLKVDVTYRDRSLHARVVAESPQVTLLLREKAHELHSVLRQAGIHADQVSVSIGGEEKEASMTQDKPLNQNKESKPSFDGFISNGETAVNKNFIMNSSLTKVVDDHWVA